MIQSKKFILKRSVWVLLSIFFTIFFVIILLGNSIANDYAPAIHGFLHTDPYKKIVREKAEGPEVDYFKSDFTQKDADGNTIYREDESGVIRPVYDDEAMRENSRDVALQAAVEGTVILSNDDALPLAENTRVSLFGVSQVNYQYLGVGSGGMTVSPPLTMEESFEKYGLELNTDLYWKYFNLFSMGAGKYTQVRCRSVNEVPWSEIESTVDSTVEQGDVAVVIASRVAGEKWDVVPTGGDDFMDPQNFLDLTEDEHTVLQNLIAMRDRGEISKVVLLLNAANPFQFEHISELDLDACVWVGMGGTMAFEQIAATLSGRGEYVVSGRLPDTYVYNNYSAPATVNFGDYTWSEYGDVPDPENNQMGLTYNTKYVVYQENIYVGYRYYETRYEDVVLGGRNADAAAGSVMGTDGWDYNEEVAYPFGYGLSYTKFTRSGFEVTENDDGDYEVSVTIKNDGDHNGKDVLQVYVQKPYTGYDEEHGIEKAAVELVGFGKTKLLEPGDEDRVTVTVKAEDFKTYDADGQKTYILEKGDYYLAAGENAHDALNNILAAKGKTTANGMDYNGNADYAHKITVSANDYETYRYSAATDAEITNRFDDVDINRYEGADQSVTYLSRKNWAATYPEKAASLKCTSEQMVKDMQYGDEPKAEEGDEMPVYGKVTAASGQLTLAMLMDYDYDDPLWQNLLDQMTLDEQQYLISYGLHHIAGVESVNAPGLQARDGPGGMKTGNPVLKSTHSFPSEVTMAATFDTEVIGRLGEAFGMEVLHTYYTIIYAPGACLHRCAFGGRNWEYFSEDGFLSGKMLAVECAGIQKYGVIVETKHFVLNEQETVRHGIATFATEQSFRELYLKAFELGVTEGNMNGVMTSFNRIGCTWVGAHKGLITDVLRGEWGFDGLVETDSCLGASDNLQHIVHPYAVAEGLFAGNDLWMCGTGDENFIEELEDNPTVMLALREACHRILYSQLHSNGMNGMDETTQIVKIKVWWQLVLDGITIATGVIAGVLILFAVASFIVTSDGFKRFVAAKKSAKEAAATSVPAAGAGTRAADGLLRDGDIGYPPTGSSGNGGQNGAGSDGGGRDGGSGGGLWAKLKALSPLKKVLIIAAAVFLVAAIVLAIVLPVTLSGGSPDDPGKTDDPTEDVTPGGEDPDPDETDPDEPEPEPEGCDCVCEICGKCYDLYCEEVGHEEKCGDGREENVFEAEEARLYNATGSLAIKYNGPDGEGYVDGFNGKMGNGIEFEVYSPAAGTASLEVWLSRRTFDFPVSNMLIQVNDKSFDTDGYVPGTGDGDKWREFVPVNLGCIELVEGDNTVRFMVTTSGDDSGLNFDKIVLRGDHMCSSICPICGLCTDPDCDIPAHAEKCQGHVHTCDSVCPICGKCYDLFCDEPVCEDKCGAGGVAEIYEAEEAELGAGKSGELKIESGGSGENAVTYVAGLNNNEGSSVTFTVESDEAKAVSLYASVSRRAREISLTSDAFEITVNGVRITTESAVPESGTGKDDWRSCVNVGLGCIRLDKGTNTIVFKVLPGSENCVNLDSITLTTVDGAASSSGSAAVADIGG